MATPSRGATDVSIIRQRQEPGGFNSRHTHDREEVTTVLSGTVTVIIPAETVHQFANSGSVEAEC